MSRALAAKNTRALAVVERRLEDLANDWVDLDEYLVSRFGELQRAIQQMRVEIEETYPGRKATGRKGGL